VLLIPSEIAAELPAAAERVIAAEQSLLSWCGLRTSTPTS